MSTGGDAKLFARVRQKFSFRFISFLTIADDQ